VLEHGLADAQVLRGLLYGQVEHLRRDNRDSVTAAGYNA
jgi:hypothetical protein